MSVKVESGKAYLEKQYAVRIGKKLLYTGSENKETRGMLDLLRIAGSTRASNPLSTEYDRLCVHSDLAELRYWI